MRLVVALKIVLNDIRLITEGEDEVFMPVVGIILHNMPKDRPVADRDHRFRNRLRVFPHPGAETSAKEYNFHFISLKRSKRAVCSKRRRSHNRPGGRSTS